MSRSLKKKLLVVGWVLAVFLVAALGGYTVASTQRILPRVQVGSLAIGGLTRHEALAAVSQRLAQLQEQGVVLKINGDRETIRLQDIGFSASPEAVVDTAWAFGHRGPWYAMITDHVAAMLMPQSFSAPVQYNQEALENSIDDIAQIIEKPSRDIRLHIQGTTVGVLYDTQPGKIIDRAHAAQLVSRALEQLEATDVTLALVDDIPHASAASAPEAKRRAQQMMEQQLVLTYGEERFVVSRAQIGFWITSGYEGDRLIPMLDTRAISQYVTSIGEKIDVTPQKSQVSVQDGKVTEFLPPRTGVSLEQTRTIRLIQDNLAQRAGDTASSSIIELPVKVTKPLSENIRGFEGITELIGKATTLLTGSPANRISNIKNGVKFLTGIMVQPGEEFSTLQTLGTVDNTTGYLPELVIKGNRTIPEFGGGLCQVSTTLFRAIMDAGLPVTQRRSHAFRVSYYETDGNGKYIGPGLDATIYSPEPDLRFRNDMATAILIYGYVEGNQVTFELYGTSDGRTSEVKGPVLLSETPAGDPIYETTDQLPVGVTKQVETAHPGGVAVATYSITYPDGNVVTKDFRSSYRRWPARYLVGTVEETQP